MHYQIGRYIFTTKEEYEAGKRDAKKLQDLASAKGSDLARSIRMLKRIQEERIEFETLLGREFVSRLTIHIKQEWRKREEAKKAQGKASDSSRQTMGAEGQGKQKTEGTKAAAQAARRALVQEENPKKIFPNIWFYLRYPILALAAAILLRPVFQKPLDQVRSFTYAQQLRQEKEEGAQQNEALESLKGRKNSARLAQSPLTAQKEQETRSETGTAATDAGELPDAGDAVAELEKTERQVMLPAYKKLWKKNKDMVGWLSIADTRVDYPVMYREGDEEYYLSHNFQKQQDQNGMLVLDQRCDLSKQGGQQIIYGHNMRSGAMFGELMQYKQENFYKKHPTIKLDSLYEKGTYEIIAVFLSQIYYQDEDVFKFYQHTDFSTQEEFDLYCSEIKKRSLYETGVGAEYGDTLIALVTCEYSQERGRLVVVAKRY